MFWRWRKMQEEYRYRVWLLHGWFSALMCLGSVFGVVTWAFCMQTLVAEFTVSTPASHPLNLIRWLPRPNIAFGLGNCIDQYSFIHYAF
jgi:hypothetical protein